MAAIRITINGVICDLYGRTITGPVKIVGEAMYTDLGPGGGPIFPEAPPEGGGGRPPGIWGGGNVPMPTPPIANVPGLPPTIDPPPINPPDNPSEGKPPPPGGGWGWHPDYGWGYFPGSGGAGPHA